MKGDLSPEHKIFACFWNEFFYILPDSIIIRWPNNDIRDFECPSPSRNKHVRCGFGRRVWVTRAEKVTLMV